MSRQQLKVSERLLMETPYPTLLFSASFRVRFVQVSFEHPEQFMTRKPAEGFLGGDQTGGSPG
jgi:hypothetical protein